jgi:hypothetical protein
MLGDPAFWATVLTSILVAVAVPLAIEHARRPILRIEPGDPIVTSEWSGVHVRVRNLPMTERNWLARFPGRWLTAFAADGCWVRVFIFRGDDDVVGFDGKWTSRQEPISTAHVPGGSVGAVTRIEYFDPQRLPGIHHITLQPGPDGDGVAIAIRQRGATTAYAYWAERIYAQEGGRPFPEHPDAELPPGSYRVEIKARAGGVQSPWETSS